MNLGKKIIADELDIAESCLKDVISSYTMHGLEKQPDSSFVHKMTFGFPMHSFVSNFGHLFIQQCESQGLLCVIAPQLAFSNQEALHESE